MKQYGIFINLYTDDYDDDLPWMAQAWGNQWYDALSPYAGGIDKLNKLVCDSDKQEISDGPTALNGAWVDTNYMYPKRLGNATYGGPSPQLYGPKKRNRVKYASKATIMIDGNCESSNGICFEIDYIAARNVPATNNSAYRHQNACNSLFVDGHVEPVSYLWNLDDYSVLWVQE